MSAVASTPFDLVIFDLDGTLADTLPDIGRALNRTLREAGLAPLLPEMVVDYVGDGAAKLIERALPPAQRGRDVGPLLERFIAFYEAEPCIDSKLYQGIAPLLTELAAAGTRTAVLTNKAGSIARRVVEALLPSHDFLAVVGERDGFPRKPDPAAALSLIQRANATPARTAMVGDGLPDMRIARAAGAVAVAAAWGYTRRAALVNESPAHVAETPAAARQILLG